MLSRTSSQGSGVAELPISDEWKSLLRDVLQKGIKISVKEVKKVWQLATERANSIEGLKSEILWV